MPERKPSPSEQPPPAIPDGGLGEAMPEWLRRPPAWRELEPRASRRRELPPPDTSVIDPATLISVDDLPDWLRKLASPRELPTLESTRPPGTSERRVIPRVIEATSRPALAEPSTTTRAEDLAPTASADESAEPSATQVTPLVHPLVVSGSHPEQPQSSATIVLGTLLGVAVVVIIVLLVVLLT